MKIEVFTDSDYSECETCGGNWDEGGYVLVDGVEVFRYDPIAGCFGNANYDESDLILLALKAVGIEVLVDGEVPHTYNKYNPED